MLLAVAIVFDTNADLSNAKFREIGRIVAHWSLLEYMMQLAIGRIVGTNIKTARILNASGREPFNPARRISPQRNFDDGRRCRGRRPITKLRALFE